MQSWRLKRNCSRSFVLGWLDRPLKVQHIRMDMRGDGVKHEEEIVIIGGGVGGLAFALALHRPVLQCQASSIVLYD